MKTYMPTPQAKQSLMFYQICSMFIRSISSAMDRNPAPPTPREDIPSHNLGAKELTKWMAMLWS